MKSKTKNYIISILFVFILIVFFALNVFSSDKEISVSERRKLLHFSNVTLSNFEEYASDQFVGRDFFRNIKSVFSTKVLRQKDDNGIFIKDDAIYKIEYPVNEKNVQKTAEKINKVYEKYLKDINGKIYYSIIPDKNYYLETEDTLKLDLEKIENIFDKNLSSNMKYISIKEALSLDDYYRTDLHWKQENLEDVVNVLKKEMGIEFADSNSVYTVIDKGEFYGSYYSQISNNLKPDVLKILTNDILENCKVYNHEKKKESKVYTDTKSYDKYDMFLDGAIALIEIENISSNTDKELIIFRDSFGSSIAPLLVDSYKKIILVDLRYMSYELLEEYIKIENQDVLFLYNTLIINQNNLK